MIEWNYLIAKCGLFLLHYLSISISFWANFSCCFNFSNVAYAILPIIFHLTTNYQFSSNLNRFFVFVLPSTARTLRCNWFGFKDSTNFWSLITLQGGSKVPSSFKRVFKIYIFATLIIIKTFIAIRSRIFPFICIKHYYPVFLLVPMQSIGLSNIFIKFFPFSVFQ